MVKMLKGYKQAKIVEADLTTLNSVYFLCGKFDAINMTSFTKEFYYTFVDETAYSMEDIANMTGNSICTIRRHIRIFNKYIENEKIIK